MGLYLGEIVQVYLLRLLQQKNGLENVLKSVPDGQIVLLKKQGLDNLCRQKLVKIIIDHLILQNNPNHKFPAILQNAAEELVELFPGERLESYFIPYSKKTNSSVTARTRGKLYSRWVNCKRALTIAKAVKPIEESQSGAKINISEKEKASYSSLLYTTCDSFEQILRDWRFAYHVRMAKLKKCDTPLEYFNLFPALKQPFGYKFLVEDFNVKYPEANVQSIHKTWPQVAATILEILGNKQIQAPELNSANVDQTVRSLRVLPWLFQPAFVRNKLKNRNCKLSRIEMADRFLMHVRGYEELESKINDRLEIFKELDTTIQPFIVAVGPLQCIQAFFVVLADQRYMFHDCLTALDVAFKVFFALDLPFPAGCKGLWQTVDQLVYKIDKHIDPSTSVVLGEIEQNYKKSPVLSS